jgi:hypothetical protein
LAKRGGGELGRWERMGKGKKGFSLNSKILPGGLFVIVPAFIGVRRLEMNWILNFQVGFQSLVPIFPSIAFSPSRSTGRHPGRLSHLYQDVWKSLNLPYVSFRPSYTKIANKKIAMQERLLPRWCGPNTHYNYGCYYSIPTAAIIGIVCAGVSILLFMVYIGLVWTRRRRYLRNIRDEEMGVRGRRETRVVKEKRRRQKRNDERERQRRWPENY